MRKTTSGFKKREGKGYRDILTIARQYKTLKDWRECAPASYTYATSKRWHTQIVLDAPLLRMSRGNGKGIPSLAQVLRVARRFETRKAFSEMEPNFYGLACKTYDCMEQAFAHMDIKDDLFTFEESVKTAKGFKNVTEWRKVHKSMVDHSNKRGWTEAIAKEAGLRFFARGSHKNANSGER